MALGITPRWLALSIGRQGWVSGAGPCVSSRGATSLRRGGRLCVRRVLGGSLSLTLSRQRAAEQERVTTNREQLLQRQSLQLMPSQRLRQAKTNGNFSFFSPSLLNLVVNWCLWRGWKLVVLQAGIEPNGMTIAPSA